MPSALILIEGGRLPGPSEEQLRGNPRQAEPARRLAMAREEAGYTPRLVVERLGICRSELKAIERGLQPLDERLLGLFADLYRVSPEWIAAEVPETLTWSDLSPELQERLRPADTQTQIRALKMLARLGYRRG